MKYPEFKWIDVAVGNVNRRNNVVDVTKWKVPVNIPDCYRTVYRYPDLFWEHFRRAGSVRGYAGQAYADYLPVDIDDAESLDRALDNARMVLNMLLTNYEVNVDELWLYFSGAKGFHILIPSDMFSPEPSIELPRIFRRMAETIVGNIKIDASIYDVVRLFRLSNTKHSKSGLYKVPLTASEILNMSVDEIKQLAREPRKLELVMEHGENEVLKALYRECAEHFQKAPQDNGLAFNGVDIEKAKALALPRDAKLCYYKILEGVGEGQRDNSALRLAVHFRKQGFPANVVLGLLQGWNTRNMPPLGAQDIEKAVKQAFANDYDFGCNDEVLKSFCSEKCHIKHKKEPEIRVSADKIYSMQDAREKYAEYVKNLENRKIHLGIPLLDKAIRGIAPGEVAEVIARAGVGKTAFLLNAIRNIAAKQEIPILFFSMEQPVAQIFERATQITHGMEGAEVERMVREQDPDTSELCEITVLSYPNVYIVDEDFLTYEELRDFILLAEKEKIGQKVRFVCVDYLGRMSGEYGTQYEVTSALAKLLKRLAKELDIALLYLHQTSRAGRTGSDPVTLDMARDSGVCEEAADFVFGLWRPEMDKQDAQKRDFEEMKLAILKNRKGPLMQMSLRFIKKELRIMPMEGGK